MSNFSLWRHCAVLIAVVGIVFDSTTVSAASIHHPSPRPASDSAPNSTVLRLPTEGNFEVDCKPNEYGRNLRLSSCREVVKLLPTSEDTLNFGMRGRAGIDVVTPWRWTSCKSSQSSQSSCRRQEAGVVCRWLWELTGASGRKMCA